jgi:hypothetical protein
MIFLMKLLASLLIAQNQSYRVVEGGTMADRI